MDEETQRRVWAAGAYKGLTPPKLAEVLGTSVDTLRRRVTGVQEWRAFESESAFLARVAHECDVPYAFFVVDFERLPELLEPPKTEPLADLADLGQTRDVQDLEAKLEEIADAAQGTLQALRRLREDSEPESQPQAPPTNGDHGSQAADG